MPFDEDENERTTAVHPIEHEGDKSTRRQAVLIVMTGATTGQTIYLETKDEWTIGRATECDIVFPDASISRAHCRLFFKAPNEWLFEDLKSSNGSWVNNEKVEMITLRGNDRIQIGSTVIVKFIWQDELESTFQRELYESATKDALTGLFSKRHFLEQLDIEFNYHRRIKRPLSLVIGDLDHFKKINDTYGHLGGDLVLKEMGGLFLSVLRKGDLVGRYGGEEVIFLLRETPLPGAVVFCDRLRLMIETHSFVYEGRTIPTTISIGIATYVDENFKNLTELIKAADDYLYKAKQSGRNRVCCLTRTR